MNVLAESIAVGGWSDPVSSTTHLGGALIVAVLGVRLIRQAQGALIRSALAIFAFSAVFLLSMSGVFHLLPENTAGRAVLLRLDHAAIFILVAGTFTPIHTILFRGTLRWGVISFIWTAAITGLTLKTIFFTEIPYWLGLLIYLALGWVGLFSMIFIGKAFGVRFAYPLIWGGLAYTVGAAIELTNTTAPLPGIIEAHEVFHVFVLIGLAGHWRFIQRCAKLAITQPWHPESPARVLSAVTT